MQGNSKLHTAFAMMISAAFSLLSFLANAQGAGPSASEPALSAGFRFYEMSGEELFANVCRACHMSDGKGAVGRNISIARGQQESRSQRISHRRRRQRTTWNAAFRGDDEQRSG